MVAARELTTVLGNLDYPTLESARQVFVAIDSQTDHLPVGSVRELWSSKALAECDAELAEAEAVHATEVANACREVLNVLGGSRQ